MSGLASAAQSVNGVLGNLGLAVTAAGMVALVKSSIDAGDELSKMSQRVGISVATLSLWNPLAKQAGVSGESFEKGLRKLSTTMLEGATGSEDAARNFTAVGVAFKNQDGTLRGTDQVLLDLAERFKAMPDGAQKTALAVQLFGKSGAELIPFLNQGRDGINELSAEMQALGVQMSGETAAQAGEFNDALDKLKLASTSIGNQIIASLLPALNDMAGGMVESAKQGGTLRVILDGVVLVLKTLALGAATVGKAFVALGEAIGAGVAAAVEALKGNTEGAKAIIADLKGSLIKRLDELASFRNSLFDPKPIEVKTPKIQADPELLQRMTRPRAARSAPDTTGAQTSLIKAQLDAELALLKNALTRQQTALDAALEDRLISVRDYHAQKTAIIGDIHGHADALEALLTDLGYRNTGGAWRHPARLALFVGDLVDRGPKQMETVSLVRRMVDAGSARAVMGNHEFNAIAWFLPDPECPGEFLRKHHSAKYGDKNRKQHQAFLSAVEGSPLHEELVTWFLTLPVCLDLPDLRVIHACWHVAALD